jgi:uncharacterized protein YgiM (DUF1202 family)
MRQEVSMRLVTVVVVVFLTGLYAQAAGAATVYVSTDTATLRNNQGVSAKVVAEVKRGQALEVLQQNGRWYYVATHQGTQGWIYQYKVTTNSPESGGNPLAILGGSSSRVAIGESSSASGIRGLNPVSERQARRRGMQNRNIQAVKDMESLSISPGELQNFWRTGKLGEYQEGS